MTRTTQLLLATGVLMLLLVVGLILAAWSVHQSFVHSKPTSLPPVVPESTEELLSRLESVLETRAPVVVQALQPGLSDAEISDFEARWGFRLSDDLRALYRWRNGMTSNGNFTMGLLPGHQFVPLDEAIGRREMLLEQLEDATAAQRAAHAVFAGHMNNWLHVLDDGAGDGYFYDPERSDAEGAYFYLFLETGYYEWFPSLRNFLSGVIECYETGAVRVTPDGDGLEMDYNQVQRIWQRLATVREY